MGTQGLSGRTVFGGRGEGRPFGRIVSLGVYLAIMPLVAGCSSSSVPWFGSSNSQTAVPPNASVAAAGQPQYAAAPGQPGYAQQTQPGTAQPATYAAAAAPPAQAPASEQGATVGSFKSSYVNFLRAFRDPPEPDPSASPGYPSQRPDPSGAGYPQQSLMGSSNSANPPQQRAYVPHPPSTYSPSGQPYTPPAQPAYAPPPAQQNYAAPSAQPAYAPRPGQQSYAAPPAQQAYSAPAAAAAPAAQSDYSDSLPYPKQSLADVFRGSTETQTVPRPPSTYTASGQPYTPPQGQGAVASAPPANAKSYQLAALSQAIAVRHLLKQIKYSAAKPALSS